jgi:hypothetical protein
MATVATTGTTATTSTATAASQLSAAFDQAIAAQAAIQQVSITRQPQLDASKEKPR